MQRRRCARLRIAAHYGRARLEVALPSGLDAPIAAKVKSKVPLRHIENGRVKFEPHSRRGQCIDWAIVNDRASRTRTSCP